MSIDAFVERYAPTSCQGILLAVGMSCAVIVGVAINSPELSPFAAFGAMIAMHITPRHGAKAKITGALAGCCFLLFAASLGVFVAKIPLLALVLLFILSWFSALPKKNLVYIGFVAKCAAMAVLLGFFDFSLSPTMGIYFCSGILFGIFLSLASTAFEKEDQLGPIDQLRSLFHGEINDPYFSLITPITVVASSLIAKNFSYSNPAWVGLTVLFVADSNNMLELRRSLDRIVGTILGSIVSYFILVNFHTPLGIALIVAIIAFFMPFVVRYYSLFSFIITCIVLLLINIAMTRAGGDIDLLMWRCIDTVFGCICILCSNVILQLVKRIRKGALHSR